MLTLIDGASTLSAYVAVLVVLGMFTLFIRESYPTEVVAIGGVSVLLVTGVLPYDAGLAVLSNPAPWTIAAMFLVMGALVRTGALDAFTVLAEKQAQINPKRAVAMMMGFVILSSAVVSNTPVVVVMIPVFVQLSRTLGVNASKLLMPLSYAAIMGGMLTLIGTSTNLLVDGVARAQGLAPFSIFEVTPVAIVLVIWGMAYLAIVGPILLPNRDSMATLLSDKSKMKFFTEAIIPPDSNLIGREVTGVQLFKREVGRSLGSLRLRRRFGVYPLAVHRRNQNIGRQLDELVVQVGDTLLLEGAPADIQRLATEMDMVDVSRPKVRAYRRGHAPIAIVSLLGIVVLAAFGVAPILLLSVVAVGVVLFTRCIDAEEAFDFIEGRLLALIFSMLAIGAALEASGAVQLIVNLVAPWIGLLPGFFVIWAIYLLTSILTEMVSNNAVAVVVTPIAIGLAQALGYDPRAFVVAVMVAASASFATPIGYQTNMLVYGPGGYKFTDFMRLGIPLNLSIGILASLVIPLVFPL
ncbi:MAG: SLC13 family permease [Rhodobacteraceae bacterium]|nr:SLC13 family permease [Paracoccaceae bacterium]